MTQQIQVVKYENNANLDVKKILNDLSFWVKEPINQGVSISSMSEISQKCGHPKSKGKYTNAAHRHH